MPAAALPGGELVEQGLADLQSGLETEAALLVSIGAARLAAAGCNVAGPLADPEHRLYALLAKDDPDSAHARFNALVRRLVSYERALECVGP
jgi:hypothetical protein